MLQIQISQTTGSPESAHRHLHHVCLPKTSSELLALAINIVRKDQVLLYIINDEQNIPDFLRPPGFRLLLRWTFGPLQYVF